MKKVIFICLLSLTTCLSRPENQEAALTQPKPTNVDPTVPKIEVPKAATDIAPTPTVKETTQTADKTTVPAPVPHDAPQNQPPAAKPTEETKTSKAAEPQNNTSQDKKVDPKPAQDAKVPDTPKPSDNNTKNKTNTNEDANKSVTNTTVTPEPATTKKNETQAEVINKAPSTDNHVLQARGFDGASFIGGIILTLGLLAIGFMGFKYYKNQTERNYHTL